MKRLKVGELEPGVSVIFKLAKSSIDTSEWTVDIIGYVSSSLVTLMAYGEYHREYPLYAYDKLAMTHLLITNEHINENSLRTYKQNLEDCYL